ncbi:carbohydrate ABC transporter permease [Flexivirga caeni]|uniref:Carbohydrate ABC transporter permease n=1 Tax=Flexivirga caeni TaxID=2294115 RepID=A0A3M9MIE4_9MICO|nr:carbohydrate ABC transporter permease [Flexivirga caeni]RNI25274.1 carbohydrate ABC transporter permease [Flexivirga caeni]
MATITADQPSATKNRRPFRWANAPKTVVIVVALILCLGPMLWTLLTSMRPANQALGGAPISFSHLSFDSFQQAFKQVDMWLLILNSVLVTGLVTICQMLTAGLSGYVFARIPFRGRGVLFSVILATMMVPMQVTIIPIFMIIRGMQLSDTLWALIIPAIPTAFGTFMMRQYFMTLPPELAEAAAIDGAGPWRTFRSIYAPLAAPGLAIVGILAFNGTWNDFFRPLIMEMSSKNYTLPLGLVSLQGNMGSGSVAVVLAGVVISVIPAILVFVFGQRALREGLTTGSFR